MPTTTTTTTTAPAGIWLYPGTDIELGAGGSMTFTDMFGQRWTQDPLTPSED